MSVLAKFSRVNVQHQTTALLGSVRRALRRRAVYEARSGPAVRCARRWRAVYAACSGPAVCRIGREACSGPAAYCALRRRSGYEACSRRPARSGEPVRPVASRALGRSVRRISLARRVLGNPVPSNRNWPHALHALQVLLALLITALLVLILEVFGAAPAHAAAENVNVSVDIVAEIQHDGSAVITDTRTFMATSGTEYYLSWGNLADSQVRVTSVELDGDRLEKVDPWDMYRSLEAKAGEYGMRHLDDEVEMSFGFGSYGQHTAVMTYHITNFVKNLNDGAQAVYWEFVPQNTTDIEQMSVSLTNAEGFTYDLENSQIWAFGFEGSSEITPQAMTMSSEQPMGATNYAVMLAVWPSAPFETSSTLDETTVSLEARAFEGSDFETNRLILWFHRSAIYKHWLWIAAVLVFLYYTGPYIAWAVKRIIKRLGTAEVENPGKPNRFQPTVGHDFTWRDVPYDGPAYDMCSMVGSVVPGTMDAVILSWLLEGRVRQVKKKGGPIASFST